MRRLGWCVLVLAAACSKNNTDYGVNGGGGGGGGGGGVDATVDTSVGPDGSVSGIDANVYVGRVCLVSDARLLTDSANCAATGAGGLTVRLGDDTNVVLTNDDGTFSIAGDPGSLPVWRVTGANIVSSFEPLGNYLVPALTTTGYNDWLTNNTVTLFPGEGSLIALEFKNGTGASTVTAGTQPTSRYEAFYSGASATVWNQGTGTDPHGMVWLPGVNVGTVTLVSSIGGSTTPINSTGIPIFDGGVTFVQVVFP